MIDDWLENFDGIVSPFLFLDVQNLFDSIEYIYACSENYKTMA